MLSYVCQSHVFVLFHKIPFLYFRILFCFQSERYLDYLPIPCYIRYYTFPCIKPSQMMWKFFLEIHSRLGLACHGVFITLQTTKCHQYYYHQQYTSISLVPNSCQQLVLSSFLMFISNGYIVASRDHFNSYLSNNRLNWTFYILVSTLSFKDNFLEFLFYNKIEENLQKFPIYPLTPRMHSIPHYQHLPSEWHIFFFYQEATWNYHETTLTLHIT